MEQKELMNVFNGLYNTMASSNEPRYMHTFGDVMKCMMKDMICLKPELAQEYIDKLGAIEWNNYLTMKEASEIVNGMNPPATWDMQTWLNAMTGLGLATEEKPYYNDYALYVAMNQVVSDHGCTIAKILGKDDVKDIGTEHLVKYANHLALDLLKDKDGVYDIRKYFLK